MWRTYSAAAFALALGAAAAVHVARNYRPPGPPAEPGWTRLPNGLRYTIRPVEGANDVAVLVAFEIGAEHDPEGRIGLAHFVEHLYVTAAAGSRPARTVPEIEALYPSGFSALTGRRTTTALTVVARDDLEAELADAAARMADLRIEQSDLDRERPRVLGQIAEFEMRAKPAASTRTALELLGTSPSSLPGSGRPEDLARVTLDEVRDRAARLYKARNARLVLVGAIDVAAAAAVVEREFARVAAGERVPPTPAPSAPASGTFDFPPSPEVAANPGRKRSVVVAYPPRLASSSELAIGHLLSWRALSGLDRPTLDFPMFGMTPASGGRVSPTFWWSGDARPAGAVVGAVDSMIARSTDAAPTPDEVDRHRKSMSAFAARFLGGPADETPADGTVQATRLAWIAGSLVMSAETPESDPDRIDAAMAALTKDDLQRFARTWLAPEGRVVVVNWYVPNPRAATPSPPPLRPGRSTRGLPPLPLMPEVRVALIWEEATQTLHRKIGDREYPDDAALAKAIQDAHDVWVKKGKADVPVTINGDARVAWSEIIKVVNLIKRCGIDKIEFAFGAPPKKPGEK